MPLFDVSASVLSNRRLSADYNVLTLAAPAIGAATEPGQFVMVKPARATEPLLRRPFSVFEVLRDQAGNATAISILNKRAGRTTAQLFDAAEGERINVLGPLGKPYTVVAPPSLDDRSARPDPSTSLRVTLSPPKGEPPRTAMHAWMVAGGVGLAPFATLAEALARSGATATLFYGARSAAELFYLDFFERLGVRLVLSTEDGSRGAHGRVTVPLEAALSTLSAPGQAMVYACGPEPMLAAVATLAARYGQPSEVSVERVMGCGMGGCYSCVIPVRHGGGPQRASSSALGSRGDEHAHLVRSCITGPVFDGAEVVWD